MNSLFLGLLLFFANPKNPLNEPAQVRVLIFARTDCPITNRYAPEIGRIAHEFAGQDVKFWIVYPDRSETAAQIDRHMADYHLPGSAISDPDGTLRKRAEAKVSPQAAVFDKAGRLVYSGRIDDRFVAFGKARSTATMHDLENAIGAVLSGRKVSVAKTRAIGCYLQDLQ